MIAVIDYGVGNLQSIRHALDAIGATASLVQHPEDLAAADRIILPGVGAFPACMERLRAAGFAEALREEVRLKGKPLLGICVGLQLLATESLELGRHEGLGWIPGRVVRFDVEAQGLKVPHVGWNDLQVTTPSPLLKGLGRAPAFYFTHSYHLVTKTPDPVIAEADYGGAFTAAIVSGNVAATQFHPEKSQENGLRVLQNFLDWEP